jgi:hypothetical protein
MVSGERENHRGVIVPKTFSGKWIAWNSTGDAIIASGETLKSVIDAAKNAGEDDPSFEKVPPANVRLVGVVR